MVVKSFLAGLAFLSASGAVRAYNDYEGHAYDNVVKCDLKAVTKSSSQSEAVAAKAVEYVNAVLCGVDDDDAHKHASASALGMANSFVDALVNTTAECYAAGYASYKINGGSLAYAQATAIAEAYAEATAVAETCHKCFAATSLVAVSYEKIFLNATAQIDTYLHGVADGGSTADIYSVSANAFVNVTVVAMAEVLLEARAKVDACASSINATIATGDVLDANSVTCQLNSSAADDEVVKNASVSIYTHVAAHVCGDGMANATFEVEAEAIGKAMATAISQVTLGCQIEGKGIACAAGKANMTKTAEAVAHAFAFGYVGATSSCNNVCHNDVSVLTDAIATVLATAASEVLEEQCAYEDSYIDIDVTETQIVQATITSLAHILTAATATSEGDCEITLEVSADVVPEPEYVVSGPPLSTSPPYPSPPYHPSPHPSPPHPSPPHPSPPHPSPPHPSPPHPSPPHPSPPNHPPKPSPAPVHPPPTPRPTPPRQPTKPVNKKPPATRRPPPRGRHVKKPAPGRRQPVNKPRQPSRRNEAARKRRAAVRQRQRERKDALERKAHQRDRASRDAKDRRAKLLDRKRREIQARRAREAIRGRRDAQMRKNREALRSRRDAAERRKREIARARRDRMQAIRRQKQRASRDAQQKKAREAARKRSDARQAQQRRAARKADRAKREV